MLKEVLVPDIGSYSNVDIIEISVSPGDVIEADSTLITLETEKATLEVPAPFSGVVKTVQVKVGDKVSEGSLIVTVEVEEQQGTSTQINTTASKTDTHTNTDEKTENTETEVKQEKPVLVPDIGSYSNVDIIEVSVSPGDVIEADSTLITLETEKATLEVPAPFSGVVKTVQVKVGDKVSEGSLIATVETKERSGREIKAVGNEAAKKRQAAKTSELKPVSTNSQNISHTPHTFPEQEVEIKARGIVHAGPGVRRFGRELGVDLTRVRGTGPKNRILKQDVQTYVKNMLSQVQSGNVSGSSASGISVAPWPQVDFAKFGEVSKEPLSRIKKLSGAFLHRNWVMVPHITQFDEADITELEQFRKGQQSLAEAQGVKLTPLVFMMKAVVAALKEFPWFNASLDPNGAELILKKYFHIGVAVDTPNGLVVPVVRDVDQKGLFQLAKELGEISQKARNGQLTAQEMQGSSFTISSLGGIGGTAFTPIINVPDVAILGVSKAQIKPIYDTATAVFKPRLLLPLSLSYDHRVIDGALGARFITFLVKQLSDIRRLLL